MKEVSMSDEEISHLESSVLPKTQRNFFLACLILLAILPVLPYIPGKFTHRALIDQMDYWSAIGLLCWPYGAFLCYGYYVLVVRLKKDIRQGSKCLYLTRVAGKRWKGTKKFELQLEHKPKNLTEKIVLTKKEYYTWLKGDQVEIKYLKKSGVLLRYAKVAEPHGNPPVNS